MLLQSVKMTNARQMQRGGGGGGGWGWGGDGHPSN